MSQRPHSSSQSQSHSLSLSLNNLHRDLRTIYADIGNAKVTIRLKALTNLNTIFDNRDEDILKLLSENDDILWKDLFEAVHDAVIAQANSLANSTGKALDSALKKNLDHISVLQKCIGIANRKDQYVPLDCVVGVIIHCFDERPMVEHFAVYYMQILKRNVLEYTYGNLALVGMDKWLGESSNKYMAN